jgi:O-antigen/teichoic acid export membrane protein
LNKLLKNSLFGSGSFVIVSFVALLTTPYFVYKLTIEVYGVYILVTSLVGYYGLVDLGLGQGVVKFVSEYVARGESEQAARYINAALFVQFSVGLIVTVLFFIFANGLVHILRIASGWTSIAVYGIRLCSLGFLFSMISSTLAAALQGLQRYDITSAVETSVNIILNLSIVGLLFLGYGLYEIVIATTIASILVLFVYFIILRVQLPQWNCTILVKKKEINEIFSFSFFLFISRASNLFANYFVRYIVSAFAGPAAVTLYVVPSKLLGAVGGVLSSGTIAIYPYTSEINTNDPKKIKDLFLKSTRIFSIISIPIMAYIALYSKQILTIWMGYTFAEQGYLVLSLLALSSMIASQSAVPNLIIIGMGYSKIMGILGAIALVSYSIFLPFFTHHYGVIGAGIGMLCSSIMGIGFVFYLTTKIVDVNILLFVIRTFKTHLLPILFLSGISLYLLWKFTLNTFIMTCIGSSMLLGYYIFLFINEDEFICFGRELHKRFLNKDS